jgi:hypothetical protein
MKTLVTALTIILLAGISEADDKATPIDAENG